MCLPIVAREASPGAGGRSPALGPQHWSMGSFLGFVPQTSPAVASPLVAGDRAPLIALADGEGIERRSDALDGRPLVLFFYPKDDTPGCTAEACAFRDSHAELLALGAEVWGVSGDDAASHQRFAQRHNLPFPLLVDQGNALRRSFRVPNLLGLLPGRVTYVIDGEGVIRHVFNNLLDGAAHRREAIDALRRLRA
jgi:peroxiredoxin Q/BCP